MMGPKNGGVATMCPVGQHPHVSAIGTSCLLNSQRREHGAEICWAESILVLVFICSNH